MIELKNITKNYGDTQVLKGIDLSIGPNQIISIVGASGAGKTTLLEIIGTLSRPTSGQLLFDDRSIEGFSDKELSGFRNQHIGFIFQFHQLLEEFSAIENVMLPGLIAKNNKSDVLQKAKTLLDRLGVGHRKDHKPSQLSGGEQQRIAACRAMINNPKVILADEPTGNLDSGNAQELQNIFFELKEIYQQSFVIVSHNEKLAERTDRKITIVDGKIL